MRRTHAVPLPFPLSSFPPFLLLTLVLTSGCGEEAAQTEPPQGWTTAEGKWWRADFDTAGAFPDMASMESLGKAGEMVLAANAQEAQASGIAAQQLARGVKEGLLELYRNDPEVVDSLFEQYARPKFEGITIQNDRAAQVEELKRESYEAITRHFREPRTRLTLGEDVAVVYPDSLREEGVSGRVRMQVRLNEEGEPEAVELVERVHPTLDRIALSAATKMRWQPAYVLRGSDWEAIPSWARFNINFQTAP